MPIASQTFLKIFNSIANQHAESSEQHEDRQWMFITKSQFMKIYRFLWSNSKSQIFEKSLNPSRQISNRLFYSRPKWDINKPWPKSNILIKSDENSKSENKIDEDDLELLNKILIYKLTKMKSHNYTKWASLLFSFFFAWPSTLTT